MNTKELPKRTVNIDATLAPTNAINNTTSLLGQYLSKPNTNNIISVLVPNIGKYYINQDEEQFNPFTRQYSRTVSWTINAEGLSVAGIPSGIRNL